MVKAEKNSKGRLLLRTDEEEIAVKRGRAWNQQYIKQQETAKAAIQQQKQKRLTKVPSEYTEAETRQHLIDIALKEAGCFPTVISLVVRLASISARGFPLSSHST